MRQGLIMTWALLLTLCAVEVSAKGGPPVRLSAEVGESSTMLTLRSEPGAPTYTIKVHGVGGLEIIGRPQQLKADSNNVTLRRVRVRHRGQGLIAVSLRLGPARSGARHVLAVRVGQASAQPAPGRVETVEGGDRIKVLPGTRR